MLQPFVRFAPKALAKLVEIKNFYIVSQTYNRALDHFNDNDKTYILLSDYDDLGLAQIHLNAVKHDKYAAIFKLNTEKHLQKIKEMMEAGSQYRLYWNTVLDAKKLKQQINKIYEPNMRRYIDAKTNWRPGGGTTLKPDVQVTFGELYIILKHGSQTLRIKFEEIEAY